MRLETGKYGQEIWYCYDGSYGHDVTEGQYQDWKFCPYCSEELDWEDNS